MLAICMASKPWPTRVQAGTGARHSSATRTQYFLPDATFESEKEAEEAIASPPTGSSPGILHGLCDAAPPLSPHYPCRGGHGHIVGDGADAGAERVVA